MPNIDKKILENVRLSATAIGRAEGKVSERERIVHDLLADGVILQELAIPYLDRIICIVENRLKDAETNWIR